MKLNKFAYSYSKPLGNQTKNNEKNTWKFTKKPGKIMDISWNFVSPKKWEPCIDALLTLTFAQRQTLHVNKVCK